MVAAVHSLSALLSYIRPALLFYLIIENKCANALIENQVENNQLHKLV